MQNRQTPRNGASPSCQVPDTRNGLRCDPPFIVTNHAGEERRRGCANRHLHIVVPDIAQSPRRGIDDTGVNQIDRHREVTSSEVAHRAPDLGIAPAIGELPTARERSAIGGRLQLAFRGHPKTEIDRERSKPEQENQHYGHDYGNGPVLAVNRRGLPWHERSLFSLNGRTRH